MITELFRYEAISFMGGEAYLRVETFIVKKETEKGFWIEDYSFSKRWVSKLGRKRFAYPTKQEAAFAYLKRKERQLVIFNHQIERTKAYAKEIKKLLK